MQRLVPGQILRRRDIAALFGGNARAFLPRVSCGEVVAGCFDPVMNPRAPDEVLVHSSVNAGLAAEQLLAQCKRADRKPIPVFLRRAPNVWEYIGRFRAVGYSTDPREISIRIYEIPPRIYEKYVREYGEMRGILSLEAE